MPTNKHHILHHRAEWTVRPEAELLRERPELVPRIDVDVHNELHRIAPPVPLLGCYALRRVNALYEPSFDTIESMDNLMLAIEQAGKHHKAHRVERKMAECAVEALDIQRAILRGNVVNIRSIA